MSHPDVDTLADFSADVLDETDAAGVRSHVDGCPDCQARLASYADVERLLHDLPPVQMPDEVAARLETSLRTHVRPAVTPLARPTGWRRLRRTGSGAGLAGLAAAAAVALLVSGVVAGALHVRNDDGSTQASRAAAGGSNTASAPRTYATTFSGSNYTKASLAAAIPRLIGAPDRLAESSGSTATGSGGSLASGSDSVTEGSAPLSNGAAMPAPSAPTGSLSVLDPLAHQPVVLFDCIAELTGRPVRAVVPLAVDIARFDGQPAAVIVLPSPGHPTDVDAWVVGPGCGKTPGGDVRLFQRVPR